MITYIEIGGKKYPMSYSVMAQKQIIKKYGSLNKMQEIMQDTESEKSVDAMIDMVEILVSQGCAYMNYFEKDAPVPENAPVVDGKWTPISRDGLEIGLRYTKNVMLDIASCISGSSKQEIEAEVKEQKNEEAARE